MHRKNKPAQNNRRQALQIALALSLMPLGTPALAVSAGQAAPAITLQTLDGKSIGSADLKNKWVVLEWTNPGCPFVQKHYQAGNMQATQSAAI